MKNLSVFVFKNINTGEIDVSRFQPNFILLQFRDIIDLYGNGGKWMLIKEQFITFDIEEMAEAIKEGRGYELT